MHTRDYSDDTARVIDEEVERILREQEARCREVLTEHRNGLDLVARALLEYETIDGSEVTRLIELARNGTTVPTSTGDATGDSTDSSGDRSGDDSTDGSTDAVPADPGPAQAAPN